MININSALYEQACSLLTDYAITFGSVEAPACASIWAKPYSIQAEDRIEELLREHFGDSIILATRIERVQSENPRIADC